MIMGKILGWVAGIVISALLGCIGLMHLEAKSIQGELDTAKQELASANASKKILQASINSQNEKLRKAEDAAKAMRLNQLAAVTEAELLIDGYESTIYELRRAPKANTTEEIRIRMLRHAGVSL